MISNIATAKTSNSGTKFKPQLTPDILTAGPHDVKELAQITADAFWDDPVNEWIFQSFEGMRHTFEVFARSVYVPRGMGHLIDGKAVAMWMLPGGSTEPPLHQLISMTTIAMRCGGFRTLGRMLAFSKAAEAVHPAEPHLYLFTVGVRPEFKGQGYGKRLLSPVLKACDQAGLPAYLENSKPENHGFYRSLGFERREIFYPKPGAPPLEAMWRAPRTL